MTQLAKKDQNLPSITMTPDIGSILSAAVDKGVPPEQLGKLLDLYERMQAMQAKCDFADAMAKFQAECPTVLKNKTARIATKTGGSYEYAFADLGYINATVRPMLNKHGLSLSWDSSIENGLVVAICTVRHASGHESVSRFAVPPDTDAKMSGAQKHAAAYTTAQRRALTAALGLTPCDEDYDGNTGPEPTITDQQALELEAKVAEVGGDLSKFLSIYKVSRLSDFPASEYESAMKRIANRARNGGAK